MQRNHCDYFLAQRALVVTRFLPWVYAGWAKDLLAVLARDRLEDQEGADVALEVLRDVSIATDGLHYSFSDAVFGSWFC